MAEMNKDLPSTEEQREDIPEDSPPSKKRKEKKEECSIPEMKDEQIDYQQENAVVSKEKERSETSFDDLPDDVHINIMKKLDLPSCLKLRVNRRLDRLQLGVKNECIMITVNMYETRYKLDVAYFKTSSTFSSSVFESLEKGLLRLALNTRSMAIWMTMHVMPNEEHCRIADALLNFEAHDCAFKNDGSEDSKQWNLPHISSTNFHGLVQNFISFDSDIGFSSITAQDFCAIRKAMLEDDCKLEWFCMKVNKEMEKSFMEDCFGVTIVDFAGPLRGRIYRTADESLEFYSSRHPLSENINNLYHMDGNLKTRILMMGSELTILFEIIQEQKAEWSALMRSINKIQLNHVYVIQ